MRHFKFFAVFALVLILAVPALADPGDRSREGPATPAALVADFFDSLWQQLTAALAGAGGEDTEEEPPDDKGQPTEPEPNDEECSSDPDFTPWPDPNGCG